MLFDVKAWSHGPYPGLDREKIQHLLRSTDRRRIERELYLSDKIVVNASIHSDLDLLIDRHLSRIIPVEILRSSVQESSASYSGIILIDKRRFVGRMVEYLVGLGIMGREAAAHLASIALATYRTTAAEGMQLHNWIQADIPKKCWVSSGDDVNPELHAELHGLRVEVEAPFTFGGEVIRYPGDPQGSFDHVVGCRCSMHPG